MVTWVVFAVIVIIAIAGIVLFNRLVRVRQLATEGWSGIDVQLKRRADLVPPLVETVKGYAAHEKDVLEQATRLRSRVEAMTGDDVADRSKVEERMSQALGKLIALAEAYPDLKANDNFLDLQTQLATIEDDIQMARRYYNGAARNLNVAVESFPSNLVAETFGFRKRDFFEIDSASSQVPEITFDQRDSSAG